MKRHEYITLGLIAIFGMVGAWLYTSGNEWLANLCVIPPSMYFVIASRTLASRGEAIS